MSESELYIYSLKEKQRLVAQEFDNKQQSKSDAAHFTRQDVSTLSQSQSPKNNIKLIKVKE